MTHSPSLGSFMFGFLSPHPHSDDYRRAYARLCVHQRQRFGVCSLPFHSYEAVFLYQLALDAGAVDAGCLPDQRCCKLGFRSNIAGAADAEAGMFCAAFALLLAAIKLDDDIRDSRSALARFAKFALRNRIERARRHLRTYDPEFDATVAGFIAEHHRHEQPGRTIALEEYVEPTAKAFGYLFGLFAVAIHKPDHRAAFQTTGSNVGRAIIAFDCAADWHRDRRRGEFNPLPDESAVEQSLEFCWHQLNDIADLARVRFGHRSRAARTASGVADRMAAFHPQRVSCPVRPSVWVILKVAVERSWLALTTGQLALAGMSAAAAEEEDEREAYAGAPPVDRSVASHADSWRRKKEKSPDIEGPIPSQKRDDCCGNTCMAGICAEGSCEACCCMAACL